MKRAAILAAFCLLASTTAVHAYTLVFVQNGGGFTPRRWPDNAQPILFQINQDTGPGLTNVTDDSDPLAAIQSAVQAWPPLADIQLNTQLTAVESAGGDGVNVITLKSTAANLMAMEMAGNPLGLALVRSQGTNIVEADVILHPNRMFTTELDTDAALQAAGLQDLGAVATHEVGHAIGLHHSGIQAATMWSLASVLHRSPASDDRAGARALYPPGATARIFGQVTVGGAPAFGAHVVALAGGRAVASALSLPDGSYSIDGLDGGAYTVYVEPLDGPHSSIPNIPCVRLGNLSGAGVYNNATLSTDLPTTFFGGNATPTQVQVAAGNQTQVSFALAAGASDVNPTFIGTVTLSGNISLSVGGSPVPLVAGETSGIAVVGPNLDLVGEAGIGFEDPAMTVTTEGVPQFDPPTIACGATELPLLVFAVTIAPGAVSGARSLALRVGGELSMMSGAVEVSGVDIPTPTAVATATATLPVPTPTTPQPTATPTTPQPTATPTTPRPTATPGGACVGDCNGDGTVTVDEIVTMVNVALGTQPVDRCPAGDADASGSITVDEILMAIGNALNGCA